MQHPYLIPQYADAFLGIAQTIRLPSAQIPMLKQNILQTAYYDLASCYPRTPLFSLEAIDLDLVRLAHENYISLTFATDVLVQPEFAQYDALFDYVYPFKQHYILNRQLPIVLSKHHRYEIKQAQKKCVVQPISLKENLEVWHLLYQKLVWRHRISGLQAFSKHYFQVLSELPNIRALAAFVDADIVSIHLWLSYQDKLYSHLAASNEKGYQHRASYAIYAYIIDIFQEFTWIDFGGNSGGCDNPQDGLSRFKSGFSNELRASYILGKIFNPDVYRELSVGIRAKNYFPLYRSAGRASRHVITF